ncbi:MAG: pirin family protein [Candidatus Poseidoniaceae archaeon]|nr:pirin family protein [Candidatus Poseidoniaceae archaeon]
MSTTRTLRMTAPTHTVLEGGGFPVRRPSAMGTLMSPFLLLDEMGPVHWAPGEAIGAPAHPHRGFETVTYMIQGAMKHEDSAGNKGDLNPGDVQWMTAGRGIIHSELPQDDFLEQGGVTHGFQIWVNLPSKDKMMNPRYQDIPSEQIPKVTSEDGKVWANVIAGSTLGVQAVIDTVIPITYIHMKIQQDGSHRQVIEKGLNGMIYVFGGTVHIDGKPVLDGQLGILTDGDEVVFEARDEDAEFLILAGPELNEPIARYGPFVMNTRDEIQQALLDYQNGTLA